MPTLPKYPPISDITDHHLTLPLQRDLRRGWHQKILVWWRSPASWPIFVFVASRLLFVAVTFSAVALLHSLQRLEGVGPDRLVWAWHRWDALWYVRIALDSYPDAKTSAFFPLMPLLMRVVSITLAPFIGSEAAAFVAGMLIANAAMLGALVVLHRLVAAEYDSATAQRAVLYLALFPKALFTFTAYSESLFLLLAIASYACMRRKRFAWAGMLAALATLDRLAGLALIVPFAVELYLQHGRDIRAWLHDGWAALLMPVALLGYMATLAITIGDPLSFAHAESAWGRRFMFPLQTLYVAATNLLHLQFGSAHEFNRVFDLSVILLWLAILTLAASLYFQKKLHVPLSLLALGVVLTLLPLSAPLVAYKPDLLSSMSRYLLAAFPVFVIASKFTARRPRLHDLIVWTELALLVVFTTGFVMGYYVI